MYQVAKKKKEKKKEGERERNVTTNRIRATYRSKVLKSQCNEKKKKKRIVSAFSPFFSGHASSSFIASSPYLAVSAPRSIELDQSWLGSQDLSFFLFCSFQRKGKPIIAQGHF